jgi:hypothetical protein
MLLGELGKAEQLGFGLRFAVVFGFLMLLLKLRELGLGNGERLAVVLFQLEWIAFGVLFCCRLNSVMLKAGWLTAGLQFLRLK